MVSVLGIHHVTAIATDSQRNLDFYAGVLGLRLVKKTVNFDDPESYHFYFGDDIGHPGSLLTFFVWPGARAGRQGSGQVAVTSFAVPPSALGFWVERLLRYGIAYQGPTKGMISFKDPDGMLLEIVGDAGAVARPVWADAPGISREHAIHGLHRVTLWVERGDETERVLLDTLGFRRVSEEGSTRRYAAGDGGPGTLVDVRSVGGFPRGTVGPGTVHHVAWRVADDAAQLELREQVIQSGLQPTPVIDRMYFHSVYFREPAGVLFELATEAPGFLIDEPAERLGERLTLPPQYESRRVEIEAILPPLYKEGDETVETKDLGFVHRYIPRAVASGPASGVTLLLLHGTGGDEADLIPLGQALLPGAAILSPRGKVLERGMPRFFRRLAEGVFDQEDLARRTEELAQFVEAAIEAYQIDGHNIFAVGLSNGANIASSLLLRRPGLLRGAILLSPMVPFQPDSLPDLSRTLVFIGAGRSDRMVAPEEVERLADLLRRSGADVTVHWEPRGHGVTQAEVEAAGRWILSSSEQ